MNSAKRITAVIQWTVVGVYVLAMFTFASKEVSSASYTGQLLAKILPHLSGAELRQYVLLGRKMGHVLAYGLLTLIVYYAALKTKKMRRGALGFAALFAFIVAIADESYQSFLHYRSGTIKDVFIDGIGIGVVVVVLWLLKQRKQKQYKEVDEEDVENELV